jgi:amidohydrolase
MEHLNKDQKVLELLRKKLHQNPEVSGRETQTAKIIFTFLEKYAPDEIITNVGSNGIIAIYKGHQSGKNVLFRCELDALPIQEINTFDHRSVNNGVSHKCGHDGHMAILCGLAIELSKNRPDKGMVILLFQPAEEDGSGALKVFTDPKFTFKPDFVFALHNLPGFAKNQIIVKNGTFTCAVNSIIIKIKGKTAHAGEPENGINPALAIAAITTQFNDEIQADIDQDKFCLITPIYSKMGKKAYGVSAGEGEIHFTVRSNSNLHMQHIEKLLESIVEKIAMQHQLEFKVKWTQSFQANENDKSAVNYIKKAAQTIGLATLERSAPFSWGEDFGLFTQQFTGAMFGLGAGINTPALHNPDYDFPDETIATGVAVFHQISKELTDAY